MIREFGIGKIISSLPEMGGASALQTSSYTKAFSNLGIILVGIFCSMFLSLLVFSFISVILLDLKFSAGLCLQSLLYQDCPFPFLFLLCSKLLGKNIKTVNRITSFFSLIYFCSGPTGIHVSSLECSCWKRVPLLPKLTLSSRIMGAPTDKYNKTDPSNFLI